MFRFFSCQHSTWNLVKCVDIIGCLDTPSGGTYILNDHDVSNLTENELADIRNKEIGFVFQTFNLLARSDLFHNVELPLIYAGMRPGQRKKLAEAAIAAKVTITPRCTR